MGTYTQPDVLRVHTPLGPDVLLLERFRGHERLSGLFYFYLDMLAEAETLIPFKNVLGKSISVSMKRPDGSTRSFHGIVQRFSEGETVPGPKGGTTFVQYQAEMVPKLWLLTKNAQSRIFQRMSVPDILLAALSGIDVSNRIQGTYEPRDYCAQYRESDFAFVCRLMEEEGIFYFFEHSAEAHRMVLADTPRTHPDVASPSRVIYDRVVGGTRNDERVTAWTKSQEVRSGLSTLRDYCFELPDQPLTASRATVDSVTAGTVRHTLRVGGNDRLELYDYPGRYAGRFDGISPSGGDESAHLRKIFDDGTRTARVRMEEEAASALQVTGEGGCRQFSAGFKFTLERHRNADGDYVLTEVAHEASVEGAYTSGAPATLEYHNTFRCIPYVVPFRPARLTPRPTVEGPQTAVVVGTSDTDPIFCDKYGRVKVQFRWDRQGQFNADSSCWIRVAQPWAGANWGAITLPRVGQEVVVGFLEGDPDEPMILGSVYNAAQMPPFPLPDFKTQSGIKSQSVGQGAGAPNFSGIAFEDAQGSELVHLHSEQDMLHSTEGNLYHSVGKEQHVHVGQFHMTQVGGLPGIDHRARRVGGSAKGQGTGVTGGMNFQDTEATEWLPSIGGAYACNLDLTLGWHRNNTGGLYSWNLLGQIVSNKFNPLGVLEFLKTPVDLAKFTPSPFRTVMGAAAIDIIMGGTVAIQYGPKFEVRRGSAPISITPSADTVSSTAIKVIATLYSILNVIEVFLPAMPGYGYDAATRAAYDLTYIALNDLLLGLWIKCERADEAERQLRAGLLQILEEENLLNSDDEAVIKFKENLQKRNEILEDFLFEGNKNKGPGLDVTGCRVDSSDSIHVISAPGINLVSALGPLGTDPSLITISALGNEEETGDVVVYGSGSSVVQGGALAWFRVETEEEVTGMVTADCGADGTLTLQSGLTQEPNCLTMSPEGITVSSLEQVKIESDESSGVFNAEGITLSVTPSSIAITPEGITLAVAESSVSITPEGITIVCGPCSIEITAEGIVISGVEVSVSGDAEVSVSAPAVMIG